MKRAFSTAAVLGVATGITPACGFGPLHELLDHLYPGIMTIGCAAMAGEASREILRQHPSIAELGQCTPGEQGNWREYFTRGSEKFGDTMEVDGPHQISNQRIDEAFEAMSVRLTGYPKEENR